MRDYTMNNNKPKAVNRSDYKPYPYTLDSLNLKFDLNEHKTRVTSTMTITPREGAPSPLVLNGEELKLISVSIDEKVLPGDEYQVDDSFLTLHPDRACTVEIVTEIDPANNSRLEGLYQSGGNFCTQNEAVGFRRITYFPDRPDVMTSFTVKIIADKTQYPVLLSNGNLIESGDLDGAKHFALWHDPFNKPCYLFALVAGDLGHIHDTFTTCSGRKVDLYIYVEKGWEGHATYAMDSLKRAMKWDEETFGLEYDLDIFNIVAVSDFNMGAMENKSLNVFNSRLVLADPDTATDWDYAAIEGVIGHEYFHNWTGDRVTCRDWFQLSLKEGLTVFRDQEFSSDMRSRPMQRINDVSILRAAQFPEDNGPLAHPVRPDSYIAIDNFYTTTVYEKGAELIRMMQTLLGKKGFRKGIDLYFERHDGQAVTCDDFAAAMADANGMDLEHFKLWYSQSGTPRIKIETAYESGKGEFTLTLTQYHKPTPGQDNKRPMFIPLKTALLDTKGNEITLECDPGYGTLNEEEKEIVLYLREEKESFVFKNIEEEPKLSINRSFSAPVILVYNECQGQDFAFLMAHDTDSFGRYEAKERYASEVLLRMIGEHQDGKAFTVDEKYIETLKAVISDTALEKEFVANMLQLPGDEELAARMEVIDPDAIHYAREHLQRAIATALKDDLLILISDNDIDEPFRPDATQAGRRSLKNSALGLISVLETDETNELVFGHYTKAQNMTDRMAALSMLSYIDSPLRNKALDDFYARYKDNTNVMDKWLGVQSRSHLPDTLEQVKKLMEHPVFSLKVPNKVRALIGGFSRGNPFHFHKKDGSGYAFLGDILIELDAINPQIAARMMTVFNSWRRYDETRQKLMYSQLKRIVETKSLSSNSYEIASKSME